MLHFIAQIVHEVIDVSDNAITLNTGINAQQYEPSKTLFFRLDKNYRPREYEFYHYHKQKTYQQERLKS